VNSGIEERPGKKNVSLMRELVERVRKIGDETNGDA